MNNKNNNRIFENSKNRNKRRIIKKFILWLSVNHILMYFYKNELTKKDRMFKDPKILHVKYYFGSPHQFQMVDHDRS